MARSGTLTLLLPLVFATGCAAPRETPPAFTQLGDDTLIVTGEGVALNHAISHAVFAIGDPDADPESGVRRVPSYHENSEYRTVERDGHRVQYEQRTIRFETPDGITIETHAVYTQDQTTMRIETTPRSDATRSEFAMHITHYLRERGMAERP